MKRFCFLLAFLLVANFVFAQANAGPDKSICAGSSVTIGNNNEDPKFCYSWKASPADPTIANAKTAKITVNPSQTTTYTLTIIGQDFSSSSSDEVVVNVITNDPFPAANATIAGGAPASIPLGGNWGFTYPETIDVGISACSDGSNWHAVVTSIRGNYSQRVRLIPGILDVTGPGGNTTQANFCKQVQDLFAESRPPHNVATQWFMLAAVQAHEDVHLSRFEPALEHVANNVEALFEALSVPDNGQSQQDAVLQIKALADYATASLQAAQIWVAEAANRIAHDHDIGGPTDIAEQGVVDPMISNICSHAKAQMWGPCASCPL